MSAVPELRADPSIEWAIDIVRETNDASIACLQRHMGVGYNRAARFIEEMEDKGVVSVMDASGKRTVLASPSMRGAEIDVEHFVYVEPDDAPVPDALTFRDRVFLAVLPACVRNDHVDTHAAIKEAWLIADESVKQRGGQS